MEKKVFDILEYHRITETLAEWADAPGAKKRCLELIPAKTYVEALRLQKETADALSCLSLAPVPSFAKAADITAPLKRLRIGGALSAAELCDIAQVLSCAKEVKAYLEHCAAENAITEQMPGADSYSTAVEQPPQEAEQTSETIAAYIWHLFPVTEVFTAITAAVLGPEEIADTASAKLKSIRREKRHAETSVQEQLHRLIGGGGEHGKMLQETLVTERDGRYCVPVKAEYRAEFPGIIHGSSNSGATLFIEPTGVVAANNRLRELADAEKQEIERILAELSALAAGHLTEIKENAKALTALDFIFAKAKLSRAMRAAAPILVEKGGSKLTQARHPLIPAETVVPVDITLGKDFNLLVVTGPNTGGKTVSLKTLGLLTLMAESGLYIPAAEGSRLQFFSEVFCDIGDEQSIEQSLSTFSGHMRAIISIIERADKNSLVLLDELCAGTDPAEGAALAIAILEHLKNKGCAVMATTHYSELKLYALETPGVKNASLAFDEATLSPTYRLIIGMPGKSNAFAIAKKLGLSKEILADAGERMEKSARDFADVAAELERTREALEKEQLNLKEALTAAKQREEELKNLQEKEKQKQEKLLAKARQEAEEILAEAKDYADKTIREVNRLKQNGGDIREMEKTRKALREKINEGNANLAETSGKASLNEKAKAGEKRGQSPRYSPAPQTLSIGTVEEPMQSVGSSQSGPVDVNKLSIGDPVHVCPLCADATIATLPNAAGELFVQAGLMRTKVKVTDLTLLPKPKQTQETDRTQIAAIARDRAGSVRTELNLIGKNTDEAAAELSGFLDDAYLARRETVTIVHGRGTGALRAKVHEVLKQTKYVKSFRLGEIGEGDTGVTIVSFK